jgi:hypothetical protein
VESREGAVGFELPGVDGLGELELDLLFLAFSEGKRAGVFSRKRPPSETTRMFSLIPSRLGLRQQIPRMMRSILTPACDA